MFFFSKIFLKDVLNQVPTFDYAETSILMFDTLFDLFKKYLSANDKK